MFGNYSRRGMSVFRGVVLLVLSSFCYVGSNAQNTWGIKEFNAKECQKCMSVINEMPIEVNFGVKREGDVLYFVCNSREWFEKNFKDIADGFCIEVISKDQFVCGGDNKVLTAPLTPGVLLEPHYQKDYKKITMPDENGLVIMLAGVIPVELRGKELEYNIVIINDKTLCYRRSNYNIDSYLWDLLDMGMYLDTVSYKNKLRNSKTSYTLSNKTLLFTIPFEKGKSDYSANDIKSLYDSLNLTNFDITKMSIRAYSSVEGAEEKNVALQEKRAKSIVSALQTYQKPNIETEIISAENWVEFVNDVQNTAYSSLANLSKQEIKDKLSDKKILDALEPMLQKHRKAIITIDLEKKNELQSMSDDELISSFKKSIADKNLALASSIQNQVFQRISSQSSPSNLIDKLEIPKQKEFGNIINNNKAFNYIYNNEDPYQTLLDFESLDALMPKNGHIKYNICVLKFRTLLVGKGMIDPIKFQKEVTDLKLYGIDPKLIKRMLINYNIIMCEYYMHKGDYVNKDKCLNYIVSNYKNIPYNPLDIINVAQYLVAYSKYDQAIKTVYPYVKTVDCNEDILFYYINLTIVRSEIIQKNDFRNILLNAYNVNPKRFCKLFNSYDNGGVTFQLLSNDYLKRSYCESCKK